MDLPAGFVEVTRGDAVVVAQAGLLETLLAAGIEDPAGLTQRVPGPHRGRGNLGRLDLEAGAFVVRPLVRGGLFGKLVRRTSFDRWRARAELQTSVEAAARGAPVLEVAAAVTRAHGVGWSHALVTREVAQARDLMTILREGSGPPRAAALAAAGRAVRLAHEAGIDHVDLNLKNVLITAAGEALVIDLDRCRLAAGPLSPAARERSLLRLLRSWRKLGAAAPEAVRAADPLRFVRAYAAGDPELRRRLIGAGRRARFWTHRLRWRLFPPSSP